MPVRPERESLPISSNPLSTAGCDELDFVDVVIFLWRWKTWILTGLGLGAIVGATINHFRFSETTKPIHRVKYTIDSSPDDNSNPPESVLSAFNSQFKSKQGVRWFVDALPQNLTDESRTRINIWLDKWQTVPIPMVVTPDGHLEITIDANLKDDRDISSTYLSGLNGVVEAYNAHLKLTQERSRKLDSDRNNSAASIGRIYNAAIKLFEKYSDLSPSTKNAVISRISATSNSSFSEDSFIFIVLGAVPDAEPMKQLLLDNYQSQLKTMANIDGKINIFKKSIDPDEISSFLPKLTFASDVISSENTLTTAEMSKNPFAKFSSAILVGGLFGAVMGFLVAACLHYIDRNKARFSEMIA